jgi:hypothetical protein
MYKIEVISVRYTETLYTVFDAEVVEHYPAVRCLLPTDSWVN